MRFEKTVKNIIPIIEKGGVIWTSDSELDCQWRLADQKVMVNDSVGSVIINTPPSGYDRYDKNMKVFASRQEAELYCAAAGLETLTMLISRICGDA